MSKGVIGKHISNPKKSASKRSRAGGLIPYICGESGELLTGLSAIDQTHTKNEKHLFSVQSNLFVCDPIPGNLGCDSQGVALEMWQSSEQIKASKCTIEHFVFSFGERQLTKDEFFTACDIIVQELGVPNCLWVAGAHHNTENFHIHFCVNRVDELAEVPRVVAIENYFTRNAAHKVSARLCYEFQIEPNDNALFAYDPKKKIYKKNSNCGPISDSHEPRSSGKASEIGDKIVLKPRALRYRGKHLSERSLVEQVQREILPSLERLLNQRAGWPEFFDLLNHHSCGFEADSAKKGACLVKDNVKIKLSSVAKRLSFQFLEDVFGSLPRIFTSFHNDRVKKLNLQQVVARKLEKNCSVYGPRHREMTLKRRWAENALKQKHKSETRGLAEKVLSERELILTRNAKDGAPKEFLLALDSILSGRQSSVLSQLTKVQRKEVKEFNESWSDKYCTELTDFERRFPDHANVFQGLSNEFKEPSLGTQTESGFLTNKIGRRVAYIDPKTSITLFIDTGFQIQVVDTSPQVASFCYLLAQEKWGKDGFEAHGSKNFCKQFEPKSSAVSAKHTSYAKSSMEDKLTDGDLQEGRSKDVFLGSEGLSSSESSESTFESDSADSSTATSLIIPVVPVPAPTKSSERDASRLKF